MSDISLILQAEVVFRAGNRCEYCRLSQPGRNCSWSPSARLSLTPLTLASYSAGYVKRAFIEPVAVKDELLSMPLFLEVEVCILVPLEETYRTAFAAVPKRWQDELTPSLLG